MLKYAKIINPKTNQVIVGLGNDNKFYEKNGMKLEEVEQCYNGSWYIKGYTPKDPEAEYIRLRISEYPDFIEYLDAQVKLNSNNKTLIEEGKKQLSQYINHCLSIKDKYPKE